MVEHLVMGLKTSPNHIGLGSALETGGWQFIDQHGNRSGFLNSPLEIFSHKTSSGLNSFKCLASKMARLKLSNNVFFFGTNGLCKTRQTLVLHWVPDKGCKHGRVPAERHIPRRRASRAASRVLRSWKCAQERHQLDPLCSKGKRRLMGSVETSLLLYV
ncbi:hypothetical protein TNCV_3931771 [Trichonephila clavipes]|nr:hypothetical protein TNCV_3931771 [Trichonephila clavipes]